MADKRAVCLNCIDGRVQLPVINWIKNNYDIDHVDMITEPGMDAYVADNENSVECIIRNIQVSIEKNKSSMIVLAGHDDCKGNPVSEAAHKGHIRSGMSRLKEDFSKVTVLGLWINKSGEGEVLLS